MDLISTVKMCYSVQLHVIFTAANPNLGYTYRSSIMIVYPPSQISMGTNTQDLYGLNSAQYFILGKC